jgi:hypothetical protein
MKCIWESLLVVVLFFVVVGSRQVFADGATGELGLIYGMTVPDADNTNPRAMTGFKGLAYVGSTWSIGGYYYSAGGSSGSGGRKFNYSFHGLEGAYRIAAGNGEAFVGLRLGLSKLRTEPVAGTKLILSPYHYGVAAGYDYFIWSMMTLGFEGFYLGVDQSSTNYSGVTYEEKSFHVFGLMTSIQLRF